MFRAIATRLWKPMMFPLLRDHNLRYRCNKLCESALPRPSLLSPLSTFDRAAGCTGSKTKDASSLFAPPRNLLSAPRLLSSFFRRLCLRQKCQVPFHLGRTAPAHHGQGAGGWHPIQPISASSISLERTYLLSLSLSLFPQRSPTFLLLLLRPPPLLSSLTISLARILTRSTHTYHRP